MSIAIVKKIRHIDSGIRFTFEVRGYTITVGQLQPNTQANAEWVLKDYPCMCEVKSPTHNTSIWAPTHPNESQYSFVNYILQDELHTLIGEDAELPF